MPELTALHIYPIKSTYRLSPDLAEVAPWGLAGDRRWMLADLAGHAVTQHQQPSIALYRTRLYPDGSLTVTDPAGAQTHVPVPSATTNPAAQGILFGTGFPTLEADPQTQAWFAERLGAVRLLYLDAPATSRRIDLDGGPADASISMVDGYPILLTTTASLAVLNRHLTHDHVAGDPPPDQLPMERFRPNLVVSGTRPWEEDGWHRIRVGGVLFRTAEQCGRCVVITIDQETGERRGSGALRALARHRQFGNKLAFGLSLVPERPTGSTSDLLGTLRLGDEVTVLEADSRAGP